MWLKRSTPQNIVIGGAAGAFPPMVGWAAVTGTVSMEASSLFLIIFLWTPPHFWALALYKQSDYGAAGVPMMPNVVGDASTKLQIFVYSLLLAASAMLPTVSGLCRLDLHRRCRGHRRVIRSSWPGACCARAKMSPCASGARSLFNYSLSYLFIVFFAFLTDNLLTRFGGFWRMSAPDEIRAVELEAPEAAAARAKRPSPPLDRLGHRAGAVCHHLLHADHRQDGPGSVRSGAVMADFNHAPSILTMARRNKRVAYRRPVLAAGMVGLAYASVPLYQLFCQVTGYGGTTQVAGDEPKGIIARADDGALRLQRRQ